MVAATSSFRMASSIRATAVIALSLMSAFGCTVPMHVIFVNASPVDVVLIFKNENREMESLTVKANEGVEIKRLLDIRFSIRSHTSTFDYGVQLVPQTFIEHVGFGPFFKRVVRAQFMADNCIYLIVPGEKLPSSTASPQPHGFPLCPR